MKTGITIIRLATAIVTSLYLGGSAVAANGQVAQFEDHNQVSKQIHDYLVRHIKAMHNNGEYRVSVGRIDNRLRLRKCGKPLQLFMNTQQFRGRSVTVGVRCDGKSPWLIYVPSQVFLYRNVVVARALIRRGQIISAAQLQLVKREISGLAFGYIDNPRDVIGKKSRRMIFPGNLLKPQQLVRRMLVKRGQVVTLIAETGGIVVRMNGKALASGTRGHFIKVKNLSSRRIIEGVVVGEGIVKISM